MNKISYICLLLTVFWLSSCQKEEIRRYEQRAGVYFSTYQSSFSFIDQPDSDIAIVRLPVDITGLPAAYDREFAIALPWVDTCRRRPVQNRELLGESRGRQGICRSGTVQGRAVEGFGLYVEV